MLATQAKSRSAVFRRQQKDHVAVALAGAAQCGEPVNDADIQLDQALALVVDLGHVADAAQPSGRKAASGLLSD